MAEEDVIIVNEDMDDDDEENAVEMAMNNLDDENAVEMEIDNLDDENAMEMDNLEPDEAEFVEKSEEEEEDIQSLADSDYATDIEEEIKQKKCRYLNAIELNNMDITIRMCCIKFYYYDVEARIKYCSDCFLRLIPSFRSVYSIRKHKTTYSILLMGSCCKECKRNLYQILPCNMCPICTN